MPTWKKVIVSGSSPTLNELTLSGDINLAPTNKIQFDGDGGHTYIDEQSDDNLRFRVGAQNMMIMVEGDTDYVRVPDSVRLSAGSSNDLQMVHDGTNSFLLNNTGDLTISNLDNDKDVILKSDDGSGGTTPYLTLDGSVGYTQASVNIRFADNAKLQIGASADLELNHDGTDSTISNKTGDLYITNTLDDKDIILRSDDGSGGVAAYLTLDGSASDIKVAQHMQFADNKELRIGNDNDLRLVSNNSNTFIDNYLGNMYIRQTVDDGDMFLQCDNGSGGLANYITLDGGAGTVEIGKDTNVDGTLTSTGDVVAFYSSDERLKDNITNIHKPLAKIDKIGGYKFTWNDKQDTYLGKDVGVLAQEIEAIMPEVVTTRKNGYKAVKYEKIVPLLIEGIKELNKKIEDIEKNCDCLKK